MRVALGRFRERGDGSRAVYRGRRGGERRDPRGDGAVCARAGVPLVAPPPKLCTDNGAMIAWAGIERLGRGMPTIFRLGARPRWPLDARAERALNNKA